MKKNMGTLDKYIRMALASVVLLLSIFNVINGTLAYILISLAMFFALTSLFSFCPLYLPFKTDTREKKKSDS
jgi:hypothetical protein